MSPEILIKCWVKVASHAILSFAYLSLYKKFTADWDLTNEHIL